MNWIKKNFDYFNNEILNKAISEGKYGKFALINESKFINFFSTFKDAFIAGELKYERGHFSVQEVKN